MLLEDARRGFFDVVVAEALDRLSRDQEDTAHLFKHLSFAGVQLVTLSEGEISELHIGLSGAMGALYLKQLARRHAEGCEAALSKGAQEEARVTATASCPMQAMQTKQGSGGSTRPRRP